MPQTTARSAAQTEAAVAAAAQHSPDLILVDVTLKQSNGVSAMRTIARNEFDVRLHAIGVFRTYR
jgi:CheY-like chemotaxis protein